MNAYRGVLLFLALVTLVGCGGDALETRILSYSEPTAALASADAELAGMVRALQATQQLPAQLDSPLGPPADNGAAALAEAYSGELHMRQAAAAEQVADPTTDIRDRADYLRGHKKLVEKTAAAVDLPSMRFDVGHRYGFFGRMTYLDDAALASRLMTARALHNGSLGRVAESLADTMRALRVAHELSRVRRVEARVLAANLRAETLNASTVLFDIELFERYEAEQLYGMLRDHLAAWPSDSRMLIGERATVIHAYEAVRGGMLDRMVTFSERQRLEEGTMYQRLEQATPEEIDADEALYLRTLAALLAVADQQQYERHATVEEKLARADAPPRLFASALFLRDLPEALHAAAEDRARVEAWTLALAATADLRAPPFRTSPLSGVDYHAERGHDAVEVAYGEGDDEVVVLPIVLR